MGSGREGWRESFCATAGDAIVVHGERELLPALMLSASSSAIQVPALDLDARPMTIWAFGLAAFEALRSKPDFSLPLSFHKNTGLDDGRPGRRDRP